MWVTTSSTVWLASRGTSKLWNAPSAPPRQTETFSWVATASGYPLVVKILRMVRFGKEIPALHHQARVLDDERRAEKAQAQKDDRGGEREHEESPAHPCQRCRARAVEKLPGVERPRGKALRNLADARRGDADRALQARARLEPAVARERSDAKRGAEQGERGGPGGVEARQLRRENGGERRGEGKARCAAEQEKIQHGERRGPFLQEFEAGIDHRRAQEKREADGEHRGLEEQMAGEQEARRGTRDERRQCDDLAREPRRAPLRCRAPRRAQAPEMEERGDQAGGGEQRGKREG